VSKPVRHQRSRIKGRHLPTGVIYCGCPTKWGNHDHKWQILGKPEAVRRFEADLMAGRNGRITVADVQRELRGHDVCCWCGFDEACHVDVLLRIANQSPA
jgi:hypothetical protein